MRVVVSCFQGQKKLFCPWKHEKTALKSCSIIGPNLFLVLATGPKPAQISFSIPKKCLPARLLYNDFDCNQYEEFFPATANTLAFTMRHPVEHQELPPLHWLADSKKGLFSPNIVLETIASTPSGSSTH